MVGSDFPIRHGSLGNTRASRLANRGPRSRGRGLRTTEYEVDQVLRDKIANLPSAPGVYLMKDEHGRIVYVGKANDLRARVRSYFEKSADSRAFVPLLERILGDIDFIVVENEKEALLLENQLIARHSPRYNAKQRGGRSFVHLRIDPRKSYPRLEVVRRVEDDGARYFGPYPLARSLRDTLRVVNRAFHLRTCSDHDALHHTRPCLLCQISRFPVPSVYDIPEEQYRQHVEDAIAFLEGRQTELIDTLRARMEAASQSQRFEEAAKIRDQLKAIERTLLPQRIQEPIVADASIEEVLGRLRTKLSLSKAPRYIECFDVSHFAGAAVVASKVAMIDGVPDKSRYRRFKISPDHARDDLASLYEAISRRLRTGLAEGDLPDLLVIDGGRGQLASALTALADLQIEGVDAVGLAKARDDLPERIYIPGRKNPIVLPQRSKEVLLLAHIRDEAHRFAHTYQGKLMRKERLRSELEALPGIGERRARALLGHFGSVEAIRKASEGELAEVVGKALARRLREAFSEGREGPNNVPAPP